jgi:hypothetical protein
MSENILKDINIYELKEELAILIKYLKKENFYVEALNVKVSFEAITITECRSNKKNEFILFLSYSNKNTIRIAEENNLNIVLYLIRKVKNIK